MPKTTSVKKYFEGFGSRKTSDARVRIYEGKGVSQVNGKPVEIFAPDELLRQKMVKPLVVSGLASDAYFTAKVTGGGVTGQLDAVSLGLSRAIVSMDEKYRPELRKAGLLTRDPREVERKKFFLRKARRRPQYSKR